MGVQYENGGGQVTLINAQITPCGKYPIVDTVNTVKSNPNVCIYPLKYVNVTVSGCDCVALEDNGCQILLISNRLFLWCCDDTVGDVTFQDFGRDQTVCALLANLTVCLSDVNGDNVHEILIVCAVTDLHSPDYNVILLMSFVTYKQPRVRLVYPVVSPLTYVTPQPRPSTPMSRKISRRMWIVHKPT